MLSLLYPVIRDSTLSGPSASVYRLSGAVHVFDSVLQTATGFMSGRCTGALDAALNAYTCV